jgi:hypothetical protein
MVIFESWPNVFSVYPPTRPYVQKKLDKKKGGMRVIWRVPQRGTTPWIKPFCEKTFYYQELLSLLSIGKLM